jgi:hypothetical protein
MNEHSSTHSGMFRLICGRSPQAGTQEGAEAHPVLQVGTATPQEGVPQGFVAHDGAPQEGLRQAGVPHPPTRAGLPGAKTMAVAGAAGRAHEAVHAGQDPEGS